MIGLFKNNELLLENELLKDKAKEQDELLFQITQENAHLNDRVEQLEQQEEIDERLSYDYYNTDTLDNNSISEVLDKITDERNTYKEVINVLCDKHDIDHDEVFNIIDDLQAHTEKQKQR